MASTEEELLGSDYILTKKELSKQTTQKGGGFFELSKEIAFNDYYPNSVEEFLNSKAVAEICANAGISTSDLTPPFYMSDADIKLIDNILENADPLLMTSDELDSLRSSVNGIISNISVPTEDEIAAFQTAYQKFISAIEEENISQTTNYRYIELVSTDISLDAFIYRTGIKKLNAIKMNNLVYPYITERNTIPSELRATLTGVTGTSGSRKLTYVTLTKEIGVTTISPRNIILITNNAKNIGDISQQKVEIDWISEDNKVIRLGDDLLFDINSEHVIQIYESTNYQVLSPGDFIKIPK